MKVLLLQDKMAGSHHNAALVVEGYWKEFSRLLGFDLDITGNYSDFNSRNLADYDIVVFNYTKNVANGFNSSQQAAFKEYMERGGHWIGYHTAAMPRKGQWEWFRHNVRIGALHA